MFHKKNVQLNRRQIEAQLKSAVFALTPNVLDKIDLTVPQDAAEAIHEDAGAAMQAIALLQKRLRLFAGLAAACLCMIVFAGGTYAYQNGKVDSVIGIDVNPSVELSVNRKNRVLKAEPLNADAKSIMEDMNLKGIDLTVAVNAVIGSLVTHGYLDDLDNAILVTVSNDSVSKASALRSSVVNDVESSLKENKVKAVVYDQQVIEEDHVKELANHYGISYGKAYFLKELIAQNPTLTTEDMDKLAPLTMEEIAREIAERSYAVGGRTQVSESKTAKKQEGAAWPDATPSVSEEAPASSEEAVPTELEPSTTSQTEVAMLPSADPSLETLPEMDTQEQTLETQAPVSKSKITVDNADYDNGVVTVTFKTKVKWKNPTVSVKDEYGNSYSAMMGDTGSSSCEILVSGLEGEKQYTFILGGISPKNGKQTTVKSSFETPVIGDGGADEDPVEPVEPTETQETKEPQTQPQTTAQEPIEPASSDADTRPAPTDPAQGQTTPAQTEPQTSPSVETDSRD